MKKSERYQSSIIQSIFVDNLWNADTKIQMQVLVIATNFEIVIFYVACGFNGLFILFGNVNNFDGINFDIIWLTITQIYIEL